MAFELKQAVIHSFEKESGVIGVVKETIVKKDLFDPARETVISLVNGIHSVLGKTGNNVVWGQFLNNGRQGSFPGKVAGLLKQPDSDTFESLASSALDELVDKAKDHPFATGGHTLFAYYLDNSISYLLVANIKQRDGLRLGDDYVPVRSVDIDMSKVQQAARINLSRYSEFLASAETENSSSASSEALTDSQLSVISSIFTDESDSEQNQSSEEDVESAIDKTYLCFVSKGRDSEASEYFVNALGCQKGVASRKATGNAIDVVEDFFRDDTELSAFSAAASENVTRYLRGKQATKQKATLSGIYNAAVSAVPAEYADLVVRAERLIEVLNDEENRVPDEFTVSKIVLDKKTKIKAKTPRWELFFEKGAMGVTANSEICYDRQNGKLIISKIPLTVREELDAEIDGRPGQK